MSTIGIPSSPMYYERLPQTVIPSLYKIEMKPDLKNFTFAGKEDVEVSVKESTNQVIVNSSQIEIHEAVFKTDSGVALPGQVTIDEQEEKAFIKFNDYLKIGNGTLSLTFTGVLNDKMKGFYRTRYTNPNGEVRYAATTQFEAPFARMAFPCWDEPAFKAKFDITIIAPKDRTVLSNTEPVNEYVHPEDSNLKVVHFAPTPVMSTYLLAFIIGEYEYLETKTDRGTRIRVYTPLNKKDQGAFALEVASKSLTFFEKYFNIPFPLSKLDHIAIPDFAAGAMENWGLVTYREARILNHPKETSSINKESSAVTISHETAHQWFGNLVTMDWWTDLWLNEGFASFMENLCTDAIHPEYNLGPKFASYAILPAMQLDAFSNSHPIEVPVMHPKEIDSIFDAISYKKGASIIRMCHDWVGNDVFRKSLCQYLTKYAYSNAITQNLWDEIEAVSGKPISKTMGYWTQQMGYPVVTVKSRQEGNDRVLKFEQKKFSISGSLTDKEKEMFWMIPISVMTSQDPGQVALSTLMSTKSCEIVLKNTPVDAWVKVNPHFMGFYRVNYASDMLDALKQAIVTKQLSAIDRLEIVSDCFALASSCQMPTRLALEVLELYKDEDEYTTWVAIHEALGDLESRCEATDYSEKLERFGLELHLNIINKLGFDPKEQESQSDSLLRSMVLNRLVKYKYAPFMDLSMKRFKGHVSGVSSIHADLRDSIYRAVASSCNDETFETFFKLYREAELHEEKNRLIRSLGATKDRKRLQTLFKFAFSEEVRSQDAWIVIVSAARSRIGREEAWKFFKENADEFWKRYEAHHSNSYVIKMITSDFASVEMAQEVEQFFISKPFPGLEKVVLRSLESIRANANWLSRESDNLKEYLNSKYPN